MKSQTIGTRLSHLRANLVLALALAALALPMLGCGGGGGGGAVASTAQTPTSNLAGRVSGPDAARAAARTAARTAARGLEGVSVTVYTDNGSVTATTDANGAFSFSSLPVDGDLVQVAASTGTILMKMYLPLAAGANSKNITALTTAASIVYEELAQLGQAPTGISDLENSTIIGELTDEIENAILNNPAGYSYTALADGANTDEIIDRITAGASLTDVTAPTITITAPAASANVTDADFTDDSFSIVFSYSDAASAPDTVGAPLTITLKVDDGQPVTVPASSFGAAPASTSFTLDSGDLTSITNSLINLTTNVTSHTAVLTVSAVDLSGNTGSASVTFTIVPDVWQTPD